MLAITLINMTIITTAVIVHYECLMRLNRLMPRLIIWHRFRIVFGVLGALAAHAIEVWIFALGYYVMNRSATLGSLTGNFDGSFMDSVYFPLPPSPRLASATLFPSAHSNT